MGVSLNEALEQMHQDVDMQASRNDSESKANSPGQFSHRWVSYGFRAIRISHQLSSCAVSYAVQ
jgi:hypothetical protein